MMPLPTLRAPSIRKIPGAFAKCWAQLRYFPGELGKNIHGDFIFHEVMDMLMSLVVDPSPMYTHIQTSTCTPWEGGQLFSFVNYTSIKLGGEPQTSHEIH